MLVPLFPPNMADAHHRVRAIKPREYASTRNFLSGAVTKISPYVTHGFISLADIAADIEAKYPAEECEKLIMEFGWREFFQHVWRHQGDKILRDLKPGLPGIKYSQELPRDIIEARTGIPVIDGAVRELYETGYLHNHARMWLAGYVVHMRKVHWRVAADWLYGYLLDGDLASNHLSWQWVAATFSSKPYVFNAENVARYAPDWASPKTAVDVSYETLDSIARSGAAVKPEWRSETIAPYAVPPRAREPDLSGSRISEARLQGISLAGERRPGLSLSETQFIVFMQVQREIRASIKEIPEAQCRVTNDCAPTSKDLHSPICGNPQRSCQPRGAHVQRP